MDYEVTLKVDYFDVEDLVRQFLLDCLVTIEQVEGIDMVETWDAINQVLSYISGKEQLREMELRSIPVEWMNIVLEHDRSKKVA